MKRIILYFPCLVIVPLLGNGQIVNGNAFIKGNFVEVGINQCGGFGSTVNAPAGYHARSGINPETISDNQLNLGFVADPAKDGWSVGTPNFRGDYFLPFAPLIGWSVVFNGNRYGTDRMESSSALCRFPFGSPTIPPFTGNNTSVITGASGMQAIWQGTNNGLELRKIVTVPLNEVYFTIRVELKNTTSSPITGVYYGDYVNPDSDAYQNDLLTQDPSTVNSIVNQNPADNQALVQATGLVTNTYIGLGSRDCRSRVFRGRYFENFAPPIFASGLYNTPRGGADDWFSETPNSLVSHNGADPVTGSGAFYDRNGCIGIAFNIGTIAPGDSTSFLYTYILNAADFTNALTETNPGFTNNINQYNSGAVITPCANSTINLKITNGDYNTWTWSPATGLNTATGTNVTATVGSSPITYTATGTGACGNRTVIVVIQPAPTPALGPDQSITACTGVLTNLTTLFNTTGATSNWTSGGSPVTNPSAVGPGAYQLIATTPNGCSDTALVNITAIPKPNLGPDINAGICTGTAVNLTTLFVTTGLTAIWSTGGNPVNNPSAVGPGIYQLIATNINGCSDTASVNIAPTAKPNLGPDITTAVCTGNTANLTTQFVTGGLTMIWTSGGNPVNNPSAVGPGVYQLVATNTNGCSDTALVTITSIPKPNLGADITTGICTGNTANLTTQFVTTGLNLRWSSGGNPVSNPSAVGTGIYQLIAVNSNGCADTALVTISQSAPVNLRIVLSPSITAIMEGERIQLSAIGNSITNCQWQPSLYLSANIGLNITATPASTIRYQAIAVNSGGCRDTASVNITVLPFTLDVSAAFTPNGDGYSDKWVIRNLQIAKQHKVIVFNRWGNKIFESTSYQNNWDGTRNGIAVPDGAYYYVVEAITSNDRRVIRKGSLNILR